jgi:hypothetical protein
MPQLQKAIPVAVAPFKKFLRVVIPLCLPGSPESAFSFGRSIARRPFFTSLLNSLPSRTCKSNHSCKDCSQYSKKAIQLFV